MGFLFLCLLRFISQSPHYSWELHMSHSRSSGSHVDQIEDLSSCVRVAWHHGKRMRSGWKQSKGHHHKIMNRIDIMRTARPLKDKKGRRPPSKECSHPPPETEWDESWTCHWGLSFCSHLLLLSSLSIPYHQLNCSHPLRPVRSSVLSCTFVTTITEDWVEADNGRTDWTRMDDADEIWLDWWIGGELHSSCLGIIW